MLSKRLCRRSWGWWFVLLDRKHFKVKLLRFDKGKSLSQQCHKMRSELWLFLSGRGLMFLSDHQKFAPERGDYINIGVSNFFNVEVGAWHMFIASVPTWVLEVQYGEKCEESDIVRL